MTPEEIAEAAERLSTNPWADAHSKELARLVAKLAQLLAERKE